MLVILAQCLNEQTEPLRAALAKGMKLIKRMAISIDSVKSEVSVIEALEMAIKRLDMGNGVQAWENGGEKESGYDKFRNWAALWKGGQEEASLTGTPSFSQPLSFPATYSWVPNSSQNIESGNFASDTASTGGSNIVDFWDGFHEYLID